MSKNKYDHPTKVDRRPEHGVDSPYGETVPFYHGDDEPVHAPKDDDESEPRL